MQLYSACQLERRAITWSNSNFTKSLRPYIVGCLHQCRVGIVLILKMSTAPWPDPLCQHLSLRISSAMPVCLMLFSALTNVSHVRVSPHFSVTLYSRLNQALTMSPRSCTFSRSNIFKPNSPPSVLIWFLSSLYK